MVTAAFSVDLGKYEAGVVNLRLHGTGCRTQFAHCGRVSSHCEVPQSAWAWRIG